MECKVVAVGKRMPRWVDDAVSEFSRRFSQGITFQLVEVATAKRGRSDSARVYKQQEGMAMLTHVKVGDHVVALDVTGRAYSTEKLAQWLEERLMAAKNMVFLIGGPDGLADVCLERADELWSLSLLTLPHGLARVVVTEALYRANSLRVGHPYHRA